MTIWWCEEHNASADENAWACLREGWGDCRIVEMDLVEHETPLTGVTVNEAKPTP